MEHAVRGAIRAVDKVLRAAPSFAAGSSSPSANTVVAPRISFARGPILTPSRHISRQAVLTEPEPIEAPLHILWPIDEPAHPSIEAFRSGWGTVSPHVKVTPVPGDHSMAVTLKVDSLAAAMLQTIVSVEERHHDGSRGA